MIPLLLSRYPGLTAAQLQESHAYAYGGCAIQDLGYYPFGDEFFSDLLHYVRSGDFVLALLRDARSADELAFALGALTHYVGDSVGHSLATNYAVPIEFPKLKKQYGPWVTYDQDPHAHVQAEFAFDVNEISKHRFAPPDYLEWIGLHVPVPLLSRAFEETYGIPLHDVLGGSQHPNLFGYQISVHHVLPRIAVAEALLHARDMPADTPGPEIRQDGARSSAVRSGKRVGPLSQFLRCRYALARGLDLSHTQDRRADDAGHPGSHSANGAGLCKKHQPLRKRHRRHAFRPSEGPGQHRTGSSESRSRHRTGGAARYLPTGSATACPRTPSTRNVTATISVTPTAAEVVSVEF